MTINEENIKRVEQLLDMTHSVAVQTDKNMGNVDGECFLANNPDYIYYSGILDTLLMLGLTAQGINVKGKITHRVF